MATETSYLTPQQEQEYVMATNAGLASPFGDRGVVIENVAGQFRHRFASSAEARASADEAAAERAASVARFAAVEKLQRGADAPPDQIAATVQAKAQAEAAAAATKGT